MSSTPQATAGLGLRGLPSLPVTIGRVARSARRQTWEECSQLLQTLYVLESATRGTHCLSVPRLEHTFSLGASQEIQQIPFRQIEPAAHVPCCPSGWQNGAPASPPPVLLLEVAALLLLEVETLLLLEVVALLLLEVDALLLVDADAPPVPAVPVDTDTPPVPPVPAVPVDVDAPPVPPMPVDVDSPPGTQLAVSVVGSTAQV